MKLNTHSVKILADLTTPVGLYLKVRQKYGQALLLETSAYSVKLGSTSMICFNSLGTIEARNGAVTNLGRRLKEFDIYDEINSFMSHFDISQDQKHFDLQAIFGFTTYNAVQYFEHIHLDRSKNNEDIPDLRYDFYRNLIVFDHFHESLIIIDNCPENEEANIEEVLNLIVGPEVRCGEFKVIAEEYSNLSNEDFVNMVRQGKHHCQRGDVFQIVLSRKFYTPYSGDDYNVYRALRSVNPSPYLYYFNYEEYRIFGSSPEAQLKVTNRVAEIHPIAGTYHRTGNEEQDQHMAEALTRDPKEVAEHVMLVDLARNDLSRNCNKVRVMEYKVIQFFSHVIHLVSRVVGDVKANNKVIQIYGDTFPAGTLSGAPKFKAMSLIDKYEPNSRSFYGGGIGLIKYNGDLNHAIIIRSFLSKENILIRQAGAGIVIKSDENSELQEVNNKLAALKSALIFAETL